MTEGRWLKKVCEEQNMSTNNIVRFERWYVNDVGDLFANTDYDKNEYCSYPFSIYSYNLDPFLEGFEKAHDRWILELYSKRWINCTDDRKNFFFLCAFAVAWFRVNGRKEEIVFRGQSCNYFEFIRYGHTCIVEDVEVAPQPAVGDRDDYLIFLEYSELERGFHFNYIGPDLPPDEPSDIYRPIAKVSARVATMFTALENAKMNNGAIFTFDQMVAEWNYFLFSYYLILDDVAVHSLPKTDPMMIDEMMKRINYSYEKNYQHNEKMMLRTIGVPQIDKE